MSRLTILQFVLILAGSIPLLASDPNFLILSDIHFDPTSDPSLNRRLASADVQSWPSILSQASSQTLSKFGEDTNWPLLQSALRRIATLPGKPRFVLVTGDLLAHHLREHYVRESSTEPEFAVFAQKTVQFLAQQLRAAVSDVPVVISLGNNDGDCGNVDYTLEPDGRFLRSTYSAIADAAGVPLIDLEDSWNSLGSYDIAHPALNRGRIIVLNTTFFSWKYENACGVKDDDPGERLLVWLEKRLAAAQARGEIVWLVYHIPPGIDGYASTQGRASTERIVTMWKPPYQAEFEALLLKYSGTVQNQFAGHTHFDDFRLMGRRGAYSSFVLLNPGISPNVHQNPALRQATFRSDGTITDLKTWYLPLGASGRGWKLGYQFRREWKVRAVDLPDLSRLYSEIEKSPKTRSQWEGVYSVWTLGKQGMTTREFAATACATGNVHAEDFRKCYCAADSSAKFCQGSVPDPVSKPTARSQPH